MRSSVFDPDLDAVQEVDSSAGSTGSPSGSIHHDFNVLMWGMPYGMPVEEVVQWNIIH